MLDEKAPWVSVKRCPTYPKWELVDFSSKDPTESGDNHHIYYTVYGSNVELVSGIRVWMKWVDAKPDEAQTITENGSANIPMYGGPFYPDRGEVGPYSAYVESPAKSDVVEGMGLPANRHWCYYPVWQWKTKGGSVATHKLGITYPNNDNANLANFWNFDWSSVVVLHFYKGAMRQLRERYPHAQLVLRVYADNWTEYSPYDWAQKVAYEIGSVREFTNKVTWANEQNLKVEGHPEAAPWNNTEYPSKKCYEDINNWNLSVIKELRKSVPWAELHYPALSQGHSDDQNDAGYVGFEIMRPSVQASDILDVHTYWRKGYWDDPFYGRRYEKVHALFPDKQLYISEVGSIDMTSGEVVPWMNKLPSYITGTSWFIWDSDSNNEAWRLCLKPDMQKAFGDYINQGTPPASTPEQAALDAAYANKPWMPINTDAALYKFAQKMGLGYPQTDEYTYRYNNQEYLGQVYNLGIVYVVKGDWENIKWLKKT